MGSIARWIAAAAATVVVACASIAGNGPADPDPDGPAGGTSSGSSGSSGATSSSGASGTSDPRPDGSAAADAAPDGEGTPTCVAPKKPNDQPCAAPAECCSDSCNEDGKCHKSCVTGFCDPINNDDCCIGTYCSTVLPPRCRGCKKSGEDPDDDLPRSCCSRALANNGKCM